MWTYHDQLSPSTEYYKVQGESLSAILDEVQSSSCDSTSFFSAFDLNVSNVSAEAGCVSQCRLEALDNLPISSRCCHVKAMKLELKGFEFGNHVGCWTLDSLWDFLVPANRFRQLSPSIYMPLAGNWYPKRERMSFATVRGNLENIRLRQAQMLQRFCPSWFNHAWSTIECVFCLTTKSSHVSWNAACKGIWEPSPSCYISEVQCWWFGIILYWARGQRWSVCQFRMFVFGSRIFYPTANQLLATCVPISKFSQSKSKVSRTILLQHPSTSELPCAVDID